MASHLSLAATRGSALLVSNVDTLVNMGIICRADIQMVMRMYN